MDRNWCLVDFVCVVELRGVFFGAKVEARVWCWVFVIVVVELLVG